MKAKESSGAPILSASLARRQSCEGNPAKAKEWKEFKEVIFHMGKTVHERAKLLAASGERNRLDISAAHVLELLERYPSLYREAWTTPSNKACRFASDGFAVGDGWFGIVDRLSAKLSADPNLHVWQVKEKYGSLRVYFCDQDTPPDPRLDKATDAALDKAVRESVRTCEICGQPGIIAKRRCWVSVRCKPCRKIEDEADEAREKKAAVKKSHKPWGGDLVPTPKPAGAWFNDMLIACKRLSECLEGLNFAKFSSDRLHQDAAMRHIWQIGEAASRQPTRVRRRHPAVGWSALVYFKKMIGLRGSPTITPRQIWDFVHKDVPELEKNLRRRWTKAEREATEARADARDARIAERRLAEFEAGRVRAIPSAEFKRLLREGRKWKAKKAGKP
ncbi:MAG: HepT-like ribonuclease domain-containing protein [Polyangia bacterium]